MREEHQASSISPDITELDQGLETITEMIESAQIEMSNPRKKAEAISKEQGNCRRS